MDRQEKISQIKELESKFLKKSEGLIKDHYLDLLFKEYKTTIKSIHNCYKDEKLSLLQSKECASQHQSAYLKKEEKFEDLFKHYEVISFELCSLF
jgi:hypothetical protein